MELTVVDPCLNSIVNDDLGITEYLVSVSQGLDEEDVLLSGPTDSISVYYGNGYDICGDLTYTLDGTNELIDQYFTFTETVNTNAVDTLTFSLKSSPESTYNTVSYFMLLTVSLQSYPSATSATIPVKFDYRECAGANFAFDQFTDANSTTFELYSDETYSVIDASVDQSPCDWQIEYSIVDLLLH